jgi:hypothetical protein
MALSVRSSSKADSTTGTAIAVSAPSGAAAGDFVVCLVQANGQTTIADNNGGTAFTEDVNDYKPNPTGGHTVSVFSRVIQPGDPSTYNFTSGASGRWSIIAICYTDSATPTYDVSPNTANAANTDDSASGSITVPSINTGVDGAIHTTFACWDTSAIGTISTPAGYTVLQTANGGGEPMSAAYKVIAAAGATGTTAFDNTEFGSRLGLSFSVKSTAVAATVKQLAALGVG